MWYNRINQINLKANNRYSQFGEELIIQYIFENIGTTNRYFVDLGAGIYESYGKIMSNTLLLKEQGWNGLMIDMEARGNTNIKEYFITPDNVCGILQKENCPKEFDFLNLDIDANDFYVLNSVLSEFLPRLICVEFNPSLPVNSSLVLKYEEGYVHDNTNKYGFSFGAGKKLLEYHNYTLIFNHLNQNLFAVRRDILDKDCQVVAKQIINFPINNEAIWRNY